MLRDNYEFVSRREYGPARVVYESIINKVQYYLKNYLTFQYELIGSGSRKLITRLKGGNKGFDFDYNLCLSKCFGDLDTDNPKMIRELFFEAFYEVLKNDYNDEYKLENSTSVITLKHIDRNNSKILNSCDFAIVGYYDNNGNRDQVTIHLDKNSGFELKYIWNLRPNSQNYDERAIKIRKLGFWNMLKELYLIKKNNNQDVNKKSFSLYIESVNEIYAKSYTYVDYDADDDFDDYEEEDYDEDED